MTPSGDESAQLQFALEAAGLGHFVIDLEQHIVKRSARHDQIFGYDTALPKWTYAMFLNHVVADEQAAVDAAFRRSVSTNSPWTVECRIRRTDGAVRHIWCSARIRHSADEQLRQMLGIIGDVTDRRLPEQRQAFNIRLTESLRPLADPAEVQAVASRILGEHLGASRVVYFEVHGDEYLIDGDYTRGVRPLAGRYRAMDFGSSLLFSLAEGLTVVESDATALPGREDEERQAFAAIQVRAHVDVPLIKSGRFVGGMTVHDVRRREWSSHEIALIEDTAERTWAALESVRAQAALRRSEERLAFVRRSSGVGFWYCDLPFDVLQWDETVKDHFHLRPSATVTIDTFYERIHPEDREATRLAIARSIEQRSHYRVDYRTLHPQTGAVKHIRAIGRTFYAADGTPTRFDGVTLDVSDQKNAEARLKESEQRFRLAADAAPVLIRMIGVDGKAVWFNQPWLAFTGRSMAQELGDGWSEGVHPDDLDHCSRSFVAASDARASFSLEYRHRRHDGAYRWLMDSGRPVSGSNGEFDGYIGSSTDLTEYKLALDELRRADRLKDEFLATMAHELRNPLAPLRSSLDALRAVEGDAVVTRLRPVMERQLLHLIRLVDDLLDVGRLTSGKLALRKDRIDLRQVVTAACETSRSAIDDQGHILTVEMPEEPVDIDGDPVRLAQAVSNLLCNAARYTPAKGSIRLSVEHDGPVAILKVVDNGIGIPAGMLDKVFEMFVQVEGTSDMTSNGLGVGLSLVKGVVELHGGSVEARSQGVGSGSEFRLRLPLALPVATSVIPVIEPDQRLQPAAVRRILIVDDNVDAAESLAMLLEMMGHMVRTAADGLSAIEAARGFQPAVVLCDIRMPGLNGYDTARLIRTEAWGKQALLVALTGYSQQEDRRKSTEAGFDHHLAKPVDVATLEALLGRPTIDPG